MPKEYWNCSTDWNLVKSKMQAYYGSNVTFYNIGTLTFSLSFVPNTVITIDDISLSKGTSVSGTTVVNKVSMVLALDSEKEIILGEETLIITGTYYGDNIFIIDRLSNNMFLVGSLGNNPSYIYAQSWIADVTHCTIKACNLNRVRINGKTAIMPIYLGLGDPSDSQELYTDTNNNPVYLKNIKAHSLIGTRPAIKSGNDVFMSSYSISRRAYMNNTISPYISLL